MSKQLTDLQLEQLDQSLESFRAAQAVPRPQKGWIRAIREAAGVSAGELGRILRVSRQLPLQFEKAEADDSISLKSLRNVAHALGCDLVYALVPKVGSVKDRFASRASARARKSVGIVEPSMVLENHAIERMRGAVEAEPADIEGENWGSLYCD